MNMQNSIIIVLLVAIAATPAAETKQITARDVIARYVEALGGQELISSHESRHIGAAFEQSGMTGQLDMYSAESGNYRMKLAITGVGDFEEGVLDNVGWSHDVMQGPQLMTGNHLASTLLRTRHNAELHYFDLYNNVSLEGEIEFDGVVCYKLRLDTPLETSFEYFHIDTGLMRGAEREQILAGDSMLKTSLVIREWRRWEGRLYPVKTEVTSAVGKQTIVVTNVSHGSVDPEAFQPPAPVLALLSGE
jgi:hypothetical protein